MTEIAVSINYSLLVNELVQRFTQRWYQADAHFPELGRVYPLREKFPREAFLNCYTDGLLADLQSPAQGEQEREAKRQRIITSARDFAVDGLDLDRSQLDAFLRAGFQESALVFARMARHYDPTLRWEDIYQAGRNVWSMNLFQYFFGLPVQVTPAIFAYSLLYPYTDNYLDDPAISWESKRQANQRITRRLTGEMLAPENPTEQRIFDLIATIENQYDRTRFPRVFESLLAIQQAQVDSLRLFSPRAASAASASPYEVDVLGLSLRKGGTATLADGYLVAGEMNPEQMEFAFGYGAFTQLMDDQEDVFKDGEAGLLTVFSQTARGWKLDGVTNRLFAYKESALGGMRGLAAREEDPIVGLVMHGIDLLLMETSHRARKLHSYAYVKGLEEHFPFRFGVYDRQRQKLLRSRQILQTVIDQFFIRY